MKLPPYTERYKHQDLSHWHEIGSKLASMKAGIGNSHVYNQTIDRLQDAKKTGNMLSLVNLIKKKIGARALVWLLNNDASFRQAVLSPKLLDSLQAFHQPRLTRLTLIQLIQLHFNRFDELDAEGSEHSIILVALQDLILKQLALMPANKTNPELDPITLLKRSGKLLFNVNSPYELVKKVQAEGVELQEQFVKIGLSGFDVGRFADVCRAHYYIETLKQLPIGADHDILSELLKPKVHNAPYQEGKRIGHTALEVLIDRATVSPGSYWQEFILNLAGDPRVSSTSVSFRTWWQPLGVSRTQKVRSWLAKEDLRLFLQAVEQYGIDSEKYDLQRMFPARKKFLEGLFQLGVIRNTRLMLGSTALRSVKKILDKEIRTNFLMLESGMSDKAVIYLDCGDFHLVEGSHSFKIWTYLGLPSELLLSYDIKGISHNDLTIRLPSEYRYRYEGLPYESVTHAAGVWQNKGLMFLAHHGISLDLESLFTPQDYKNQLSRYGIPVASNKKTVVPEPKMGFRARGFRLQ